MAINNNSYNIKDNKNIFILSYNLLYSYLVLLVWLGIPEVRRNGEQTVVQVSVVFTKVGLIPVVVVEVQKKVE